LNILENTYNKSNTPLFMEEITFMKHECKITILETKVFPELQKNIWRILNLVHVLALKLEIHLL